MNLLIDIGNSRLKWAVEHDGLIGGVMAMDYRQPDFSDRLRQCWLGIAPPKKIAIAAVSARAVSSAVLELSETLWPGIETLIPQSSSQAFGVSSAYDHPEKLGVDRWLAMIGAHRHYAGALCVADCGTAITFDALQADGRHLGGLIAPGLTLMKKTLASNTADLSFTAEFHQMQLANETNTAIANGVLLAAVGLIERAMQTFSREYQLILTGGDAEIVAAALSIASTIDKELVLKGLAVFGSGERAI